MLIEAILKVQIFIVICIFSHSLCSLVNYKTAKHVFRFNFFSSGHHTLHCPDDGSKFFDEVTDSRNRSLKLNGEFWTLDKMSTK